MHRFALDEPDGLQRAADVLRAGGIAALPTDTIYGFSCALTSDQGYRRIVAIKGDESGRRYLCLAASLDMVADYIATWGCTSREEMSRVWPAALTGVFASNGERCPPWVGKTVAVRVPADRTLRRLVAVVGTPLVSTSVNASGRPPIDDPDRIASDFAGLIDALVTVKEAGGGQPSTLVDFTGTTPRVLRPGGYLWSRL